MNTPETQREQEESAYERLVATTTLTGTLVSETNPAKRSETLRAIISNGETNLEQVSTSANQLLPIHSHMEIASAQVNLALVESDEATKTKLVQDAMNHCDVAIAAGLACGITLIPAAVIPWSMAIMAEALPITQGEQNLAIQQRISTWGKNLPEISAKQSQSRQRGIEALLESQTLLAVSDLGDSSKRSATLQNAMQLARESCEKLASAGDINITTQAQETLRSIHAAIEHPSPMVAAYASVPLTEQATVTPKVGKGGRMRNFAVTFIIGSVIALALSLVLTNALLMLVVGFAVTMGVGLLQKKTAASKRPKSSVISAQQSSPPQAGFCAECGNQILLGEEFCRKCETPVTATSQTGSERTGLRRRPSEPTTVAQPPTNVIYCRKCGTQSPTRNEFCRKCGAKLE